MLRAVRTPLVGCFVLVLASGALLARAQEESGASVGVPQPGSTVVGESDDSFDAEFESDAFDTTAPSSDGAEADPIADGSEPADPTLEVFQDADTRWLLALNYIVAQRLEDDDFEEVLAARGYGGGAPSFGGELTALRRLTKWLSLGARLGVRHRHWNHFHLTPATMFGVDLQLVANARWVARFGDVGVDAAGGLGFAAIRLNGTTDLHVLGRAQAGPMVAIHVVGPLRAIVRFGYDFFQREIAGYRMNSGGGYFAVGFEVRE